jgi:hypothetical protein
MSENKKMKGSRNPKEFVVGSKDLQGSEILHVYITASDYVIYKTKTGIAVYTFEDNLPDEEQVYWKRMVQIGPEIGEIKSLQPEKKGFESIDKEVVRGIYQALEGKIELAKSLLKIAKNRLIRLRCLKGRLEYLISSFVFTLIPLFFLLFFDAIDFFKQKPLFELFASIATCGAIGGFLSVSLNVWKLEIDLDAGSALNSAAGGSRILIAMMASIFVYFAIKSELILGTMGKSEYAIYVACIISGFSESFIPNIILKMSETKEIDDNAALCKKNEDI